MGRSAAAEFAIEDDEDDEKMEGRKEVKLLNARKIMFATTTRVDTPDITYPLFLLFS
jgi:hypothetical protein